MLQCDNNNQRQPDNQDTDTEEDIEIEDGDRQCTQQKVGSLAPISYLIGSCFYKHISTPAAVGQDAS